MPGIRSAGVGPLDLSGTRDTCRQCRNCPRFGGKQVSETEFRQESSHSLRLMRSGQSPSATGRLYRIGPTGAKRSTGAHKCDRLSCFRRPCLAVSCYVNSVSGQSAESGHNGESTSRGRLTASEVHMLVSETDRATATASARMSPFSSPEFRLIRSRLVPFGTVGGRIAPARNPSLSNRCPASSVRTGSPIITGMIGPRLSESSPTEVVRPK